MEQYYKNVFFSFIVIFNGLPTASLIMERNTRSEGEDLKLLNFQENVKSKILDLLKSNRKIITLPLFLSI